MIRSVGIEIKATKVRFQALHSSEIFFSKADTLHELRNMVLAVPKSYILQTDEFDPYCLCDPCPEPKICLTTILKPFYKNVYLKHAEIAIYNDGPDQGGLSRDEWDLISWRFEFWKDLFWPEGEWFRHAGEGRDENGSQWDDYWCT